MPVGIIVSWVTLVFTAIAVEWLTGRPVPTCLFKRFTGYPCVGCGSTRGVMAAMRGNFAGAFLYNPLIMALLVIGPMWILAHSLRERRREVEGRPRVCWSSSQRTVAWIIGIALFAANWAYVLWRGN